MRVIESILWILASDRSDCIMVCKRFTCGCFLNSADYVTNRLFWVDAKLHMISSCQLDGGDQRMIRADQDLLRHPFAITVFEDFLYWSDWESESIHKVNKFGNGDVSTVMTSLHSPMDVHIYHKLKQPKGEFLDCVPFTHPVS